MVGVKKYEDEEIRFILEWRKKGRKPKNIVDLCREKWPRREFKESGIKYVFATYGNQAAYVNPSPSPFRY
jgi:hypothetical protein